MRVGVDDGPGQERRAAAPAIALRAAVAADSSELHALIARHLEEGRLLPRALGELVTHAARFVVAVQPADGGRIVGCAELAPLSPTVAEVRSLVVSREARRMGLGRRLLAELGRRARRAGVHRVCAFAHDPTFFVRLGFSIVPHTSVPEKIALDCHSCPLVQNCGQYALALDLRRERRSAARTSVRTFGGTAAGIPVESRV